MTQPKAWKVGEPLYGWQLMGGEEPQPSTPAQRQIAARLAGCFKRDAEQLMAAHRELQEQEREHTRQPHDELPDRCCGCVGEQCCNCGDAPCSTS